jgi:hypothetical protein
VEVVRDDDLVSIEDVPCQLLPLSVHRETSTAAEASRTTTSVGRSDLAKLSGLSQVIGNPLSKATRRGAADSFNPRPRGETSVAVLAWIRKDHDSLPWTGQVDGSHEREGTAAVSRGGARVIASSPRGNPSCRLVLVHSEAASRSAEREGKALRGEGPKTKTRASSTVRTRASSGDSSASRVAAV